MKKASLTFACIAAIFCSVIFSGCSKESCSDGVKNQDETGVDCGGPCTACETCSDGIQNQSETGVDCGGPCGACPTTTTFSGIVVGGGDPTDYHFVNATTGTRYQKQQGSANQQSIDFVYYWSANDGETIGAPDDAEVAMITSLGVSSWTTKRATRFQPTTLTYTDFQNAAKADLIAAATGASATEIDNLYPGDVHAFKTASGKSGMVYIQSRDLVNSAITFSIKIEK